MADPGFVKREGRGIQMRRRGGGGGWTSDTFFSPEFLLRHFHYGVGVTSACQTDLRGEKQKKKKKKKKKIPPPQKKGGRDRFAPPPLDLPLSTVVYLYLEMINFDAVYFNVSLRK